MMGLGFKLFISSTLSLVGWLLALKHLFKVHSLYFLVVLISIIKPFPSQISPFVREITKAWHALQNNSCLKSPQNEKQRENYISYLNPSFSKPLVSTPFTGRSAISETLASMNMKLCMILKISWNVSKNVKVGHIVFIWLPYNFSKGMCFIG